MEKAYDPHHSKLVEAREELVSLIECEGRYSDAEKFRRQTLDKIEKVYGKGSIESTAGAQIYREKSGHRGTYQYRLKRLRRKNVIHRVWL